MKFTSLNLETLNPDGVEIVSDVTDSLGRLLAKAPCKLDAHLKKLLLARGVRSVFIRDRRESPRECDVEALEQEMALLDRRLVLLEPFDHDGAFIRMVREVVRNTYLTDGALPEHWSS